MYQDSRLLSQLGDFVVESRVTIDFEERVSFYENLISLEKIYEPYPTLLHWFTRLVTGTSRSVSFRRGPG